MSSGQHTSSAAEDFVARRDRTVTEAIDGPSRMPSSSATLLEVFTRDRVDSRLDMFDLLARAKQSLAVHPRLAWLQVDECREAWGLKTVPVD